MALIFIAIPTKGTVSEGALTGEFLKDLAALTLKFPEHTFISPMVQDYALLKYMPNVDATWEVWGRHCRTLIERSDQVWVMTYYGYAESVGVRGEVEHAMKHEVLIQYVNPETI
jgi:hypothetical protein